MDERVHFASLLFACQMGIVAKRELIAAADKRIVEAEKPEAWLIDISTQADSAELEELILRADERVYLESLRLAYGAWVSGDIPDSKFAACCETLWKQAGQHSRWYADLVWIGDEFDLVEQSVFRREESRNKIKVAVEKLLKR